MKNKSLFLVLGALLLSHCLGATEYDTYRRFWKMDKEAQEKVQSKAQEIIREYDAQQLPVEAMKTHRDGLVHNIQRLEALVQQCKDGTLEPELAKGCENENNYVLVHVFKLLLKHIEQKVAAETEKRQK